ncbi:MAG TPA: hypothetical protein VIV60_21430 [Polyangiaceae bacterium]
MLVRDVSSLSTHVLAAIGLLGLFNACERDPAPVPKKIAARRSPAAAGGAPSVARQALAAAGNAGQPALPGSSEFAAALGNIKAFTAASDQPVKVQYIEERYDSKNQFDIGKNRFKAVKAAAYHVCAALSGVGKDFSLSLYVNGTRESMLANSRRGFAEGCRTVNAKANDTLEVWVQQSTGESVEFNPDPSLDWLTIDVVQSLVSLGDIDAFSAPPSTFTKVPYAAKHSDPENLFDAKSHRFTAGAPGDYHVCAALTSGSTDFELDMSINGNRENAFAVSSRGAASGCRTVRLSKGQYLEVSAHQGGAAPLAFAPSRIGNWLTIDKASSGVAANLSLDNSNALTVPPGTFVKVPYVNKTYDDANQYDLATSRFTALAPDDYRVCASLAPLKHDFELDLYVNGVRDKAIAASNFGVGNGCRTVRLPRSGDFVEVWVKQAGEAPATFDANQFWNWLTIEPLGTM